MAGRVPAIYDSSGMSYKNSAYAVFKQNSGRFENPAQIVRYWTTAATLLNGGIESRWCNTVVK